MSAADIEESKCEGCASPATTVDNGDDMIPLCRRCKRALVEEARVKADVLAAIEAEWIEPAADSAFEEIKYSLGEHHSRLKSLEAASAPGGEVGGGGSPAPSGSASGAVSAATQEREETVDVPRDVADDALATLEVSLRTGGWHETRKPCIERAIATLESALRRAPREEGRG